MNCKFCGCRGTIEYKTERNRGYVKRMFICGNCGKGIVLKGDKY